MVTASNALTQSAIERLQETAVRGREKWRWLALATAGIALALAIFFAVLIARPIRQLDQAIRRMGSADFSQAVSVNGPQDLRYLGQRLEWLRVRLAELEQQQYRFLRHVSHELKTPLTAVREGAELLRDEVAGKLTREQKDIVRIVRENTLQLQKLIEDLLKYQQTRAVEPAKLGQVALDDIARRVLREHKLAALARGIAIDTELRDAPVHRRRRPPAHDRRQPGVQRPQVLAARRRDPRAGRGTSGASCVLEVIDDGPRRRPRRARADLRVVLPGQGAARRTRQGVGARARDRP